jgi:hypothetical protein
MSIYDDFTAIKTQGDYIRVKKDRDKNIVLRSYQEKDLKKLNLTVDQIQTVLAPIDIAIASANTSITKWEQKPTNDLPQ